MKLTASQIFVDDQEKALGFYTNILGFKKKEDVPIGKYRWLTIVSNLDQDGIQILLKPSSHPAVRPFKEALVRDKIPYATFTVENIKEEYDRLLRHKVTFLTPPADMGNIMIAIFDDTCGNLIQMIQNK